MKVKTVEGHEVEITLDEAKRIHNIMAGHTPAPSGEHETPAEYHKRAFHNIRNCAEYHGIRGVQDHEDDMKELFAIAVEEADGELLGEIVEWFISAHDMKVRA